MKLSKISAAIYIFLLVLFDQVSKYLASLLGFDVQVNKGISFTFFETDNQLLLSLFALCFMVFLIYWLFEQKDQKQYRPDWSVIFILAGGISNFLDRIFYGGVRDFLPLNLVFIELKNNLADWFIFIGIIALILKFFSEEKNMTFERKKNDK